MSKILFTGATGLVGSRVYELLNSKHECFAITREPTDGFFTYDLFDFNNLENFFSNQNFEYLIHFAAFTAVDEAEKQRGDKNGICHRLNVEVTEFLAKLAKKNNIKFIHISTDFVFDGKNGPYDENSKTGNENSLSWYGWTKKLAEEAVLVENRNNKIIRISYPYRAYFTKGDFARDIITKIENATLYPLFDDQFLTPTFIDTLADFLLQACQTDPGGIFHIASSDITTPFKFGQSINEIFNFHYPIAKGSIKKFQTDFPDRAQRPINGGLKSTRLSEFNFSLPSTYDSLQLLKTQLNYKSAKIS